MRRLVAVATAMLALVGPHVAVAAQAVDVQAASASASGLTVVGIVPVAPTPTVTLAANEASPPSALGPFTQTLASFSVGQLFSSEFMAVGASAGGLTGESAAGFVEARSAVQGVSTFFGTGTATAQTVGAACRVSGETMEGMSVIEGGVLLGQPVNPTPPPNTVVTLPNGTVTFNEQVLTSAEGTTSLMVNAIHARLEFGVIPAAPNPVEAIIGSVRCEVALSEAVPPSTTVPTTTVPTSTFPTTSTTRAAAPATTAAGGLPTTGAHDLLGLGLVLVAVAWGLRSVTRRRPPADPPF